MKLIKKFNIDVCFFFFVALKNDYCSDSSRDEKKKTILRIFLEFFDFFSVCN